MFHDRFVHRQCAIDHLASISRLPAYARSHPPRSALNRSRPPQWHRALRPGSPASTFQVSICMNRISPGYIKSGAAALRHPPIHGAQTTSPATAACAVASSPPEPANSSINARGSMRARARMRASCMTRHPPVPGARNRPVAKSRNATAPAPTRCSVRATEGGLKRERHWSSDCALGGNTPRDQNPPALPATRQPPVVRRTRRSCDPDGYFCFAVAGTPGSGSAPATKRECVRSSMSTTRTSSLSYTWMRLRLSGLNRGS